MIDVNVADSLYCAPLELICQPLSWWSSAASWAQAFLTVLTFAIALVAQSRFQKAAEAKQDMLREATEEKEKSFREAAEKKQDMLREAAEEKEKSFREAAERKQDMLREAAEMREDAIRAEAARKEEAIRVQARIEKERNDSISALVAAIPLKTRLLDALSISEVLSKEGSVKSLSETFLHGGPLLDLRHGADEAARLMDAAEPTLRAINVAERLWSYLEVRKHIDDADVVSIEFIEQLGVELTRLTVVAINAVDRILQPPAQT